MIKLNRIYFKEAMQQLSYKDNRSLKKWCNNNDVKVLADIGSNRNYLIFEEFELAKNKEILKYIQVKKIERELLSIKYQIDLKDEFKENYCYKVIGKNENECLSRLYKKLNNI